MPRPLPCLGILALGACVSAQDVPTGGVDLGEDQHSSLREAFAGVERTFDSWFERFELRGFVAARAFDTARGGSRPDGAIGVQAGTLFVDAEVRDVGRALFEIRYDYFEEAGNNEVSLGEAYLQLDDITGTGGPNGLNLRIGRFDLPFAEWYLLEDPNRNRMIGFPAMIPYRWDEGVLAFADYGGWGFAAALTDGTYSRNSQVGVAPAATLRMHTRPCDALYVSASGIYVHEADAAAICTGGSLLTPVGGGVAGTSPSAEVRVVLAAVDAKWQPSDRFHLQVEAGTGHIDDFVSAFDRTFYWWTFEPSVRLAPQWQATFRWSAVGTFDAEEGYLFESRPYGNGAASFGFDQRSLQRFAAGLSCELTADLVAKVEVGFDRFRVIDASPLDDDTRVFSAAELVLTF